jgi:hypothetical protein
VFYKTHVVLRTIRQAQLAGGGVGQLQKLEKRASAGLRVHMCMWCSPDGLWVVSTTAQKDANKYEHQQTEPAERECVQLMLILAGP